MSLTSSVVNLLKEMHFKRSNESIHCAQPSRTINRAMASENEIHNDGFITDEDEIDTLEPLSVGSSYDDGTRTLIQEAKRTLMSI
ncbi:hypothetical protein GBA52_007972 [Prunus armeniaca]|nr:hypothetical protein GBA52_007972 [Prunus armeniaca]